MFFSSLQVRIAAYLDIDSPSPPIFASIPFLARLSCAGRLAPQGRPTQQRDRRPHRGGAVPVCPVLPGRHNASHVGGRPVGAVGRHRLRIRGHRGGAEEVVGEFGPHQSSQRRRCRQQGVVSYS